MPKTPPASMQHHLGQRLAAHASGRWPQLARVHLRFRGQYAYIDGELTTGETLSLCRLRFGGVLHTWGFALYLASRDAYRDSKLPSGLPMGSPEECLDCAAGLYLTTQPD